MVWGITKPMVTPLDWLATVSQPFIVALLGLVAWYLKKVIRNQHQIQDDNQFILKAINGDPELGYPGLMKRTNRTKGKLNTVIRNQRTLYDKLQEYGVVEGGELDPAREMNGPDPTIEDLD